MAGNWKMYKTSAEATTFFARFRPLVEGVEGREIVICPPYTALASAVKGAMGTRIAIGAQNVAWAKEGAFTGEISPTMLRAAGASYAIIGHSERRENFGETDQMVMHRAVAAIECGLTPIICVGEQPGERESGRTEMVLVRQFARGIAPLNPSQFGRIIIAYEPLWAVGSGRTATPEIAAQAHRILRGEARSHFGDGAADALRILYGGSVRPFNTKPLMAQPDIDGVLVGMASLDPQSFAAIVKA